MSKTKTKLKNQLRTAKEDVSELAYELILTNSRLQHTEEVFTKMAELLEAEKQSSNYWKDVAIKACKDRADYHLENIKLDSSLLIWKIIGSISIFGFIAVLIKYQ